MVRRWGDGAYFEAAFTVQEFEEYHASVHSPLSLMSLLRCQPDIQVLRGGCSQALGQTPRNGRPCPPLGKAPCSSPLSPVSPSL